MNKYDLKRKIHPINLYLANICKRFLPKPMIFVLKNHFNRTICDFRAKC